MVKIEFPTSRGIYRRGLVCGSCFKDWSLTNLNADKVWPGDARWNHKQHLAANRPSAHRKGCEKIDLALVLVDVDTGGRKIISCIYEEAN